MNKHNKTLAIFLLISTILVAELLWWMVFTNQNNSLYLETVKKKYELEKSIGMDVDETELQAIEDKVDRKLFMFVSESIFVIILILVGIYLVYRSFKQELRSQKQQQNFLLSVTHELKTPLASIKLYLQTMQAKKQLSAEKKEEFLSSSLNQLDRLTALINQVLESTREDFHLNEKNLRKINISSIVRELIDNFTEIKMNKHSILENVFYKIEAQDLELILSNLLKNAVSYSTKCESVLVTLVEDNSSISLTVSDTACGIPDDEKERVFDRFYRIGTENTRTSTGTGLGLFIVKQLVQKYNGKVFVRDNETAGSVFHIIFPKRT